jgi:protein-S-isoprenylcysteine O-methyltransferase Ste14
MKQRIKLNGIVIILGCLSIIIFRNQLILHRAFFWDDILEIVGLSFILLGQLLRVSARGHKSERSQSGHQLIQDGPYSIVRNPMYLGIILIGVGTVFFILELWAVILFALLFVLRYQELFIKEEKILEDAFGQKYIAYKKIVPRILPNPADIFKKDVRSYLPLKLCWFKRESLSILLVLGACLLFEIREEVLINGWSVLIPETLMLLTVGILFLKLTFFLAKKHEKNPSPS